MIAYIELKRRWCRGDRTFEGELSYTDNFVTVETASNKIRIPWSNILIIVELKPAQKPIEYGPVSIEAGEPAQRLPVGAKP